MSPLRKRILIGLGLFIGVLVFSLLIYWQFFLVPVPLGTNTNSSFFGRVLPNIADSLLGNRTTNRVPVNGPIATINQRLPQPQDVANGGPTIVSTLVPSNALSATVGGTGRDVQYYDPAEGKFWRVGPDGRTKTLLSNNFFPGAKDVTWSTNGQKAIVSFPDESKIVYDFSTQTQATLPKEARDIGFSPDANSLVYKLVGDRGTDRWLAVSNSDGSGASVIENLSDKDLQVSPSWSPNQQVVATFTRGASGERQEILFYGLRGENFPAANVAGRGFDSTWAPDGNSILYSVFSSDTLNNPNLWIMDGRPDTLGQRQVDLGVETFVDKCTYAAGGGTVYCAVPRYLPAGSGQVRELARTAVDDFYSIDIATGAKRLLAQPTDAAGLASYNATDVSVSSDGSLLYFRDARTNTLHQIRLK